MGASSVAELKRRTSSMLRGSVVSCRYTGNVLTKYIEMNANESSLTSFYHQGRSRGAVISPVDNILGQ